MWLITPEFFISVVQKKPTDTKLCLRARCAADLDRLRDKYLPSLGKTLKKQGTDYPFRAFADRGAVARAMADIATSITYSNMKNETRKVLGADREHAYHNVWADLLALEPRVKRSSLPDPVLFDESRFFDEYDTDEEDVSFYVQVATTHCTMCSEEVPVFADEVDSNLPEQELLDAITALSGKIAGECQYVATLSHWGVDSTGRPIDMETQLNALGPEIGSSE